MDQDESILEVSKLHFAEKFPLNKGQKNIIEEIITWKSQPPLVKTGRSTFLIIDEPSLPFKGIKIKGCGYFDPYSNAVMQPSTDEGYEAHIQNQPDGVKEIHYQIEVNDKDEIYFSVPKKRPYGAQIYDQAVKEFEACQTLLNAYEGDLKEFPFYFPIGYAKYKDMIYKDKPLGVCVLGIGDETEKTLGNYFAAKFEEKGLRINPELLEYWQNHLAPLAQKEPRYFDILSTLRHLAKKFGKTLSQLHEHFVDHDSHLFNASVNNKEGQVMIFDLDHVLAVSELSDQKYFYYCLKDFELGLVAVMSNFMLNGLIDGLSLFEKENRQIDEFNIIKGFFEGYFGELNHSLDFDVKSLWKRILLTSNNQLLDADHKDKLSITHLFCEHEREQSYLDIFPYLKDKIKQSRPDFDLTQENHTEIINKFLKQKTEISKAHNVT
ncbi:hypothetical protein ACFLZH_05285 [Patescibacteria group bacterium]